jgi:predicted histone-like DNA-binding protein
MSVRFKTVEKKPAPGQSGPNKFYASIIYDGEDNLETLTKRVEKMCTVSGADIRAVLYALVDVMNDELADGKIVRLGDLGSMRLSIGSTGEEKSDTVSVKNIKGAKILFTPGVRLKKMLKDLEYIKS